MPDQPGDLWSDGTAEMACAFAFRLRRSPDRVVLAALARHPRATAALMAVTKRAGLRTLGLPAAAAAMLRSRVDRDHRVGPMIRLPVAILDLDSRAARMQGRSSQAVRTNCRRALDAGCTAKPVGAEVRGALNTEACAWWLAESGEQRTAWPFTGEPSQVAIAGLGPTGELLVGLTATITATWAYLDLFTRFGTTPETSPCRYLAHAALVDALRGHGVEHLAAEGPLTLSAGLRYQQNLLGYEPARLAIP